MITALFSAATGMEAQETNINVIANNLANVNTTGFKRSRANFQDLLYANTRAVGSTASDDTEVPTGIQIVGRPYDDLSVFQAAAGYENAVGPLVAVRNRPTFDA